MFIVFTPQKLDFSLTFGVIFINEYYKFDSKMMFEANTEKIQRIK